MIRWAIASAILALSPTTSTPRAEYLDGVIAAAAGDDVDASAALVVTLVREGGLDRRVELCDVEGLDGLGAFGLNPAGWGRRTACGPARAQARTALHALELAGWPSAARAFKGYLGARTEQHHEVRARVALLTRTRPMLACACSGLGSRQ